MEIILIKHYKLKLAHSESNSLWLASYGAKGRRSKMKTYAILGSFVSLAGYAILFIYGGWWLAFGALIAIWGNNLERKRDIIKWCDTMILRDKLKG